MTIQIDVDNRKGGVGKTTFCIHLAIYLAQICKKRVLLLDGDGSNCAISKQAISMERDPLILDGFRPAEHPEYETLAKKFTKWNGISCTSDICFGEHVVPYPTQYENLNILPAYSSNLTELERSHRSSHKEFFKKYYDWYFSDSVQKNYDFVLIDSPPLKTLFGDICRHISDGLVIAVQPTPEGYEGMKAMLQAWTQEAQGRTVKNPYKLLAIQIMNYDKRIGQQKDICKTIENNAVASKYLGGEEIGVSKYYQEKAAQRLAIKKGSIFDLKLDNKVRKSLELACKYIFDGVKICQTENVIA